MEKDFLNQNYENQKISNRLKTFEFIFCKIILILLFQLLIFYIKIKVFSKLFKEIKNEEDVKLYMKNRTEFYFNYRLKKLKKHNITYNESNLITFQDKLNYLIIHGDPELKSDIVDKIKIHQYSKKILGKDICVPILKVYENVNEINFDDLPKKFVLKTNHGSKMNLLFKDKLNFDIKNGKI
jgi:hypothetical protein